MDSRQSASPNQDIPLLKLEDNYLQEREWNPTFQLEKKVYQIERTWCGVIR